MTEAGVGGEALFDLPAVPTPAATQLALLGEPSPVRLPAQLWRAWLSDPAVVARYHAKVYKRSDLRCFVWRGAVSSTGHASFRASSLPGRSRRGTVPAHLFGYQLAHGVIPRLGWSGDGDPVLCHQCDFAACQNPAHMRLGTPGDNRREWAARHRDPSSPLADLRGPAGRARAVAAAINTALAAGESEQEIEARIAAAEAEGRPLALW